MKTAFAALCTVVALSACAAAAPQEALPPAPEGSNGWQAIGETSDFGPQITPLELIEDSRCPMNARCVWAGTVKVLTRISLASGTRVREEVLTINEPVSVADGSVTLVAVLPENTMAGEVTTPPTYRFAYRFDGGL